MVTKVVSVTVTRLKTRLLKVSHPKGYQLVVGGRLLLTCDEGGLKNPHPDLPAYSTDMFPGSFEAWSDNKRRDITVAVVGDNGREKEIGVVRACTLLFTAQPVPEIKAWLRSKQ